MEKLYVDVKNGWSNSARQRCDRADSDSEMLRQLVECVVSRGYRFDLKLLCGLSVNDLGLGARVISPDANRCFLLQRVVDCGTIC